MSGTATAGSKKKWLIGAGVLIVLAIAARFINIPESDSVVAEREQAAKFQQAMETAAQPSQAVQDTGIVRDMKIEDRRIDIWDTAPDGQPVDLDFSRYYTTETINAIIRRLMEEGYNPKDERITISVRLVEEAGKSVTGSQQQKSFGRAVYRPATDKVEWINQAG